MPIVYLKTGQRYPCISLNPLVDSVIMFSDIIQKTLEHWRDMLICRSEKIPMISRLTLEFSNCKYMYLFSLYSPSLYIISAGFPLHFEIGGTFGLISYFLYPQCIAAYRGPHHFWGYKPNFGGKIPSAEGKWECCSVLVLPEQIFIETLIRLCTCIIIIYASLESCFLTDIAFKFVRKLLVYRTLYRKYCSRSFIHNFP